MEHTYIFNIPVVYLKLSLTVSVIILQNPHKVQSIELPEPNFNIPFYQNEIPFLSCRQCSDLSTDFDGRENFTNPSRQMSNSFRFFEIDMKGVFGPRIFVNDIVKDENDNLTERMVIGVTAGADFCRISSFYKKNSTFGKQFGNELVCYHKSYLYWDTKHHGHDHNYEIPDQEWTPVRRKPHVFSFIAKKPYDGIRMAMTFEEDLDDDKPLEKKRNKLRLLPINETSPYQQFTVSQCLCQDWQKKGLYTNLEPATVTIPHNMTVFSKNTAIYGDGWKKQDEINEYCRSELPINFENKNSQIEFEEIFKDKIDYRRRHFAFCEQVNSTHTECRCRYDKYHLTPGQILMCGSGPGSPRVRSRVKVKNYPNRDKRVDPHFYATR